MSARSRNLRSRFRGTGRYAWFVAWLAPLLALAAVSTVVKEDSPSPRPARAPVVADATPVTRQAPEEGTANPDEGTPVPTEDPDLLLPDLETTLPDELYIEEGPDGRRLLRFDTTVRNVGQGPLELAGERQESGGAEATQFVHREDGEPDAHRVGSLSFSEGHGHWHLDDFAHFELWPADGDPRMEGPAATQNKITFCLIDEVRIEPPPEVVAEEPMFLECDWSHQGISEGWSETYNADLPEQWVLIDGLPDGRYTLRITLDPDGMLLEAGKANNVVTLMLDIEGNEVRRIGVP